MDIIKTGSRIKYYRKLLGITQKELAGNHLSIPMIKSIETNKRRIAATTATIILSQLREAAERKGFKLNIRLEELLMSDAEYARYFCLKKLEDNDGCFLSDCQSLVSIAEEYSLNDILIDIYEKLINYSLTDKKYTDAILYLKKQYEISTFQGGCDRQVNNLLRTGTCYYMTGDYNKSIAYYSRSYEVYKSSNIKDTQLIIKILYNLALNHAALKKFNDALAYTDMLFEIKDMNENQLTTSLILRSSILIDLQRYEDALLICEDLIKRNFDYIYMVQNNIGFILKKLCKFEDSIRYFTDSINNQLKAMGPDTTLTLMGIADAYKKEGNMKASMVFYEYGIKNAIDFDQPDRVVSCILALYDIYKSKLNLESFYLYFHKILDECKNQAANTAIIEKLDALGNSLVV